MLKVIKKQEKRVSNILFSKVLDLEQLGWDSNFYKRKPKKITVTELFQSFWQMHQKGKNTLRNWCTQLKNCSGHIVSEQSLNERIDNRAVILAKMILSHALNSKNNKKKLSRDKSSLQEISGLFHRILIRDSTTQQLPSHLSEDFSGSHSHGRATAIMRIQALFNFTDEKWIDFEISAFTDNDQKAATCIEKNLQPKDLVLQDLGYFSLDWLSQLIEKQYVITKWKSGTHLFNQENEKLDLVLLLKNKKEIDIPVLVGAKKKLLMRLTARKLPCTQARKRIKEAKKNRHSKSNHSDDYYELLKYEIYLTNVSKEMLDSKNIAKLYGLRWHIEILFKSWKSYANFKTLFEKGKMNLARTQFTIYAVLIEYVYLQNYIFNFFQINIKLGTKTFVSCLKFMDIINDIFESLIRAKSYEELLCYTHLISTKAVYKKHSKRKNTKEKYLYVNELHITKC